MDEMWIAGLILDGLGAAVLVSVMVVALLASLRLWFHQRRAAAVLGALGALLLGVASFCLPVELAAFASMDNGRRGLLVMVGEILGEGWFLLAWGALMLLTALPAALNTAALWLAVPRFEPEPTVPPLDDEG